MVKALNQFYDLALEGTGPFPSVTTLGDKYLELDGSTDKCVRRFLRYQTTKASACGFAAGVGGVATMSVALPTNIAVVLMLQVRTVATIAYMCGHDVTHDAVRTLCFLCLCGSGAKDAVRVAGKEFGLKMATSMIKRVPGHALARINRQVGFRLVTKFGHTGVVNLGRLVPFAGGFVCATLDGVTTHSVGRVARRAFRNSAPELTQ
jgi:hypothetical protein